MTNLKGKDFDIDSIMCELQNKRKIFHSEDDLKFSLATVIQRQYKYAEVRLERPMEIKMVKKADNSSLKKTISIDITVFLGHDVFFLELKYKTKKLSAEFLSLYTKDFIDEEFKLTDQLALPIGRFLFRKDIYRLEKLIENKKDKGLCKGYFIAITNDNRYENEEKKDVLSRDYSFHDQSNLVAIDPGWNYKKTKKIDDKHWTKSADASFKLNLKEENKYQVKWKRYFPKEKVNETIKEKKEAFRYCIVEVNE
jgi:hypothetical protein